MADDLAIRRCWFHKTHYDIPKRRIAEITARCCVIPTREILMLIKGELLC